MIMKMAYGKKQIELNLSDSNLLQVVEPPPTSNAIKGSEVLENAFASPVSTKTLREIIHEKQAANAVIVVNDITRPTPYNLILPPLLSEMEGAGIAAENITLLVALGIHRPHTDEENRMIFGDAICSKYCIENHNCDENLVSLGYLSNGMELVINKTAADADLLITTGLVNLHYFAGYSGGRKSILPGVAGRKLIEINHKMMSDERACLGNYSSNPVSDIMIEAARRAGVDYIINVVTAGKNEILYAAAGDVYDAWMSCVKYCEKHNVVPIQHPADIVIAGCGGYPKDINMYQSQKALDSAALAVNNGGTIILVAECSEGLGEETFEEWISQACTVEDIINRFYNKFELGGHKAYAICRTLKKADIILVSSLSPSIVSDMFLQYAETVDDALRIAREKHGDNPSIIIMPEASKTGIKITNRE
ncbi:transcriptional regulator [hydrocarbon metagenome]|uniref:Transcriptional regulator n=1 Tax=hydrocarbon metagenome TaxID=938273 RepID=A0A0W8E733_9ZZZZ